MNAEQRAALRRLAEESGFEDIDLKLDGDEIGYVSRFDDQSFGMFCPVAIIVEDSIGEFIASANPQAIRELLDYIDHLEDKIDDLVMSLDAARG